MHLSNMSIPEICMVIFALTIAAYKNMDGKKIDGQRIIVDAERGRVEDDWKPRYLGGGLGGHRRADRNKKTEVYTPRSDDGDRRSHRRSSRDDKKRSRDRDHSRKRDRSRSKHDKKKHRDEEKRHDRKHY